MNPEEIIAGLTDAQAEGLACIICGRDYLCPRGSRSIPVGHSVTGSQLFACVACDLDAASRGDARR